MSSATQNAVHTVRARRLNSRPIFSCSVLVLGRQRHAVVGAEHGDGLQRMRRCAAPAGARPPASADAGAGQRSAASASAATPARAWPPLNRPRCCRHMRDYGSSSASHGATYYQVLMRPKGRRKARLAYIRSDSRTPVSHSHIEVNRMDRSSPQPSRAARRHAAPGIRLGAWPAWPWPARSVLGLPPHSVQAQLKSDGAADAVGRAPCPLPTSSSASSRRWSASHVTTAAPKVAQARPKGSPPKGFNPRDFFPDLPDDHPLQRVLQEPAQGVARQPEPGPRPDAGAGLRLRHLRRRLRGHQQPRHRRRQQDPGQLRQGQQVRGRAGRHRPAHRHRAAQDQGRRRPSRS